MLTKFSDEEKELLIENYMNEIKPLIDKETIFCVDPGDIAKRCSRKQEGLSKVWDGDAKKSVNGEVLRALRHIDKYGNQHDLKMWHIQVELPENRGVEYTLLIVHGYDKKDPEPRLLLTNMDGAGKQKSQGILKIYLCRWRIEEYYRFKKMQFDLENVRVMSLNSIKMMNLLVSMLSGKLAIMAAKRGDSALLLHLFKHAKRVYEIPKFTLYALADGIYETLSKTFVGIEHFLKPKPQSEQLTLFKSSRYRYCVA
jgi:hypothetical protein